MNKYTLGQNIKIFRKRAGLSQLELETATGSAPGSISRIESEKVNPTKETLFSIATALKLLPPEKASLFGLGNEEVNGEDTERAVELLREDFQSETTIAMLLDDKKNVVFASEGMYSLLPYPREQLEQMLGHNLLELIMDPRFGVNQMIENKQDFFPQEIALFKNGLAGREREEWYTKLLEELRATPDFSKFEQAAIELGHTFPAEARKIRMNINSMKVYLVSNFRQLNQDPRFEVVEYLQLTQNG